MPEQPPPAPPGGWDRILLVGFMGAGKSRLARELARLLRWREIDFDREIERRAGRSIPEIFSERGEAGFREIEGEVARSLLATPFSILATGGGWPAVPGRMEGLDPAILSIWLRVSPEVAVRRTQGGHGRARPLLDVPDPLAEAERLLRLREPYYRLATWTFDVDRSAPGRVARRIASVIREQAGPGSRMDPGGDSSSSATS